jgi:two-component sensor histidine kinase
MRQTRVIAWAAAGCVAVGALRAAIQIILLHVPDSVAPRFYLAWIVAAAIWIPVLLLAIWIWNRRWSRLPTIAALAGAGVAIFVVEPAWLALLFALRDGAPAPASPNWFVRLDVNLVMFAVVASASWAIAARGRQRSTELESAELDAALADAQLHVLTLQLHPHFLFNTLNLISQLAYESAVEAEGVLRNLRALLVQSLDQARRRDVSLGEEVAFLRAYLDIQQRRFGERLRVHLDVDEDARTARLPHLVLQPLVENSLVHAVAPRASMTTIHVSATTHGDRVAIRVADDGPGLHDEIEEGMGLRNTRLRLDQLYGGRYALAVRALPAGGVETSIDIPRSPRLDSAARLTLPASTIDAPQGESTRMVTHVLDDRPFASAFVSRVAAVAGWAAVAALWTEWYIQNPPRVSGSLPWYEPLIASSLGVLLWLALTPAVVRLARWIDLSRGLSIGSAAAHVVLAVVVSVAQAAIWMTILFAAHARMFTVIVHGVIDYLVWNLFAYAMIVAFATVGTISERRRATALAAARTREQLSSARSAAIRLRLQPGVLLAALDSVAAAIRSSAEEAEATIARAGDLLRALLDRVDTERHSLDDELALVRCYFDVINRGPVAWIISPGASGSGAVEVPALSILSLASTIRGNVDDISIDVHARVICVSITAGVATVDDEQLSALRRRLGADVPQPSAVHLSCKATSEAILLRLEFATEQSPRRHPERLDGIFVGGAV